MTAIQGSTVPEHVGIIMDGNGRWAKTRGLPRTSGHLEGLKAAKRIIRAAAARNIRFMTLYAFSTENWKRPPQEVSFLMNLVGTYLKREYPFYRKYRIRIRHTGDLSSLPLEVGSAIREVVRETEGNTGLTVILAVNYGGRNEILRATERYFLSKQLLNSYQEAEHELLRPESHDEELFGSCLDNPDVPAPDLIIRTAGEKRLSNFLLWQGAYSELYFSDTLWPSWKAADFDRALADFSSRKRRYGGE